MRLRSAVRSQRMTRDVLLVDPHNPSRKAGLRRLARSLVGRLSQTGDIWRLALLVRNSDQLALSLRRSPAIGLIKRRSDCGVGEVPSRRGILTNQIDREFVGGEGGIRTLDGCYPIHTFQACSFNRSDTSPIKGGNPNQPHPGARVSCCRCSLPGLTGFTTYRREGTGVGRH